MFSDLPIKLRANLAHPVIEAVTAAGEEILRIYNQDFNITFKQQQEPLTEADLASNKIILKALKKTNIAILSEETADNPERVKQDLLWIVDPLDGTKEFINKNGEFSILVGLAEKGIPVLGIIYQPTTQTLFLSSKGEGAYEKTPDGWKRLKTTSITALSEARGILSRNNLSEEEIRFLEKNNMDKFTQKGSAGLKAGEICRGNAEFYFNGTNHLKEWDTCAAHSLIIEAGGSLTAFNGEEITYNKKDPIHNKGVLFANNSRLHEKIILEYKNFKPAGLSPSPKIK